MISILCCNNDSVYKSISGVDVWDQQRDAFFYTGSNPVVTHAPCAQWSQMRGFAHNRPDEKELAYFCFTKVVRNGGVFEHPKGSSFFKSVGVTRGLYCVDQVQWGFRARKSTLLYFVGCKPLAYPVCSGLVTRSVELMDKRERSAMTLSFALWLIDCVKMV